MPDEKAPMFKELLDDPIIAAVMDRDGVSRMELCSLMATMRDRLHPPVNRLGA